MTMTSLEEIAPQFISTAHRIGMCVAATVDHRGAPRTRVVQPVWTWDGVRLDGWMSTVADLEPDLVMTSAFAGTSGANAVDPTIWRDSVGEMLHDLVLQHGDEHVRQNDAPPTRARAGGQGEPNRAKD